MSDNTSAPADAQDSQASDDTRTIDDSELITGEVDNDLARASESGTQADLMAVLNEYETHEIAVVDGTTYYSLPTIERGDPEIAVVYESGYAEPMTIDELLRDVGDGHFDDVSYEELLGYNPKERLREEIYATGGTNYHATGVDSAVDIIVDGKLETRNETRGINNRGQGRAVFTSSHAPESIYGDVVFEIDIDAMIEDGFKPPAEKEPPVENAEAKEAVAREFHVHDYRVELESGLSRGTNVFYDDIPIEYTTIQADTEVINQIETEIEQRFQNGELTDQQYEQAVGFLNAE
jgi:hypothetical protein